LSDKGNALLRKTALASVAAKVDRSPVAIDLGRFGVFELQVLWYFKENPGDKVRHAANVLGVDAREINRVLNGPLKSACEQGSGFCWSVKKEVSLALDRQPAGK
jgi:hypothetical protein